MTVLIIRNLLATSVCLLIFASSRSSAMTDPATGISFPSKIQDLDLAGVGVRKKGPIKVYSVGVYAPEALKSKLATLSRTADKILALATLRSCKNDGDVAFLLKMNFKVGAEKMVCNLKALVSLRHHY